MTLADHMVYLVDDEPVVARAIVDLLAAAGFNAISYRSAADYLAAERPEVPGCLVLDITLPDADGLEFQKNLRGAGHPPVVFIAGQADVASSVRAMKQGAVDYLPKPFAEDAFLEAVVAALQQDCAARRHAAEIAELQRRYHSLTNRERDVLPLIVSGLLNKQAAALLGISEVTFQIHRGHVMQKMKARSLAELVRMSSKLNIPLQEDAVPVKAGADGLRFPAPSLNSVWLFLASLPLMPL